MKPWDLTGARCDGETLAACGMVGGRRADDGWAVVEVVDEVDKPNRRLSRG